MKDSDLMPFGKYKGEKLGDVPASYLLWLGDQPDFAQKNPGLSGYIEANRNWLEQEKQEPRK